MQILYRLYSEDLFCNIQELSTLETTTSALQICCQMSNTMALRQILCLIFYSWPELLSNADIYWLAKCNILFAVLDRYHAHVAIASVPATRRASPIADFFSSFSLNTILEKAIVTRILSLSIGATTLTIPF